MKLIDKDALVAWLKERIREYWSDSENSMGIYPYALEEVIKYVYTLEVKEVDLNEEIEKCLKQHNMLAVGRKDFTDIAKTFFELGLKARKEEVV